MLLHELFDTVLAQMLALFDPSPGNPLHVQIARELEVIHRTINVSVRVILYRTNKKS